MTFKEYKAKKEELEIQSLNLDKDYINFNKTYNIGDKLKVYNEKDIFIAEVFVADFQIESWNGDVRAILKKIKKDGNMSEITLSYWADYKLELIQTK